MNPFMESLRPFWEKAEYCTISLSRLKKFARQLAGENLKTPSWRGPLFPKDDDEIFIEFLGITNSINFCFTDPETGNKFDTEYPDGSGIIYKGSNAMTACIKRAMDSGVPILSPEYLTEFNRAEAEKIFRYHSNPMPMMTARISALRDVGHVLLSHGTPKSFAQLFSDADYRLFNKGNGIVEKVAKCFFCYHDQSSWNDSGLLFYKRAQLLPMVYYGRALDSNGKLPLIRDPENFGVITDYAVPNALRVLGILRYQRLLAEMIDDGCKIIADSNVELEIRTVTARIMLKLLDYINIYRQKAGKQKITMAELDYPIWQAGKRQDTKYRHHLTYTTAY